MELKNYRRFQAGPDPFGRVWDVVYRWLQTGISIRHADTVDVKFHIWTTDEPKQEKVLALRHPDLLRLSAETGEPLTDPWCMKLAALHMKHMIETDDDMEKSVITVLYDDLKRYAEVIRPAAVAR